MRQDWRRPPQQFGEPPDVYSRDYLLALVRALNDLQRRISLPHNLLCSSITALDMPRSGAGLKPGEMWVDPSGIVRLVREDDVFAGSVSVEVRMGRVTVP